MSSPAGRYFLETPGQCYLAHLAELARQIPTATVQGKVDLRAVVAAWEAAGPRPGWLALFTKALAFVAAAHPELRQVYQQLPSRRLYEHPITVAAVLTERPLDDDVPELWARLHSPERLGLLDLDGLLKHFKEDAGDKVGQVRRVRARARWPHWARKLAWWRDGYLSGPRRARRLGTVALASAGQHGAALMDALYPATAVLTYGAVDRDGGVDVRLKFDARLLTSRTAASILQDLERVLTCEVLMELRYYQRLDAA